MSTKKQSVVSERKQREFVLFFLPLPQTLKNQFQFYLCTVEQQRMAQRRREKQRGEETEEGNILGETTGGETSEERDREEEAEGKTQRGKDRGGTYEERRQEERHRRRDSGRETQGKIIGKTIGRETQERLGVERNVDIKEKKQKGRVRGGTLEERPQEKRHRRREATLIKGKSFQYL